MSVFKYAEARGKDELEQIEEKRRQQEREKAEAMNREFAWHGQYNGTASSAPYNPTTPSAATSSSAPVASAPAPQQQAQAHAQQTQQHSYPAASSAPPPAKVEARGSVFDVAAKNAAPAQQQKEFGLPQQNNSRVPSALEYAGRRGQDEIDQVAERMKRQEAEKRAQMDADFAWRKQYNPN